MIYFESLKNLFLVLFYKMLNVYSFMENSV